VLVAAATVCVVALRGGGGHVSDLISFTRGRGSSPVEGVGGDEGVVQSGSGADWLMGRQRWVIPRP